MESFRQYITEVKAGPMIDKYLKLIQKSFNSKTMIQSTVAGKLEVEYDEITLVWDKQGYLVGFKEDNEYYEVSKSLRSIKDLKKSTAKKFFGRKTKSKALPRPKQLYNYIAQDRDELSHILETLLTSRGIQADLNDIDVSRVIDTGYVFYDVKFNGDISKWDVSNVTNMSYMFRGSSFNGDISKWNVSNVTDMYGMFMQSEFNGDISKWKVSNVYDMENMFVGSKFGGDISKWNVSNVTEKTDMFLDSPLEGKEPKWYK